MSEAREEANRRWPKDWKVEEGTWRDGAINGFVLGAEWAVNRGTLAEAWGEGYWVGINRHTGPGNPYRDHGEVDKGVGNHDN